MGKVICIDSSGLFFPCVFSWERQMLNKLESNADRFIMPSHTVYFNSIISSLKKIGVDKDDIVIIALEGKSWRKDVLASYKAQREEEREKHKLINWVREFDNLNRLHDDLDSATNFHFIREWKSESDDICAIVPKVFSDKECVIVTGDKDLFQLAYYQNVKIFNVNKKVRGSKGMYEDVANPLKIIADKARLGDKADNLIPEPNEEPEDAELRYDLVNLLELPENIETAIRELLENLPHKELHLENLPKFKNCEKKFMEIYNPKHKITYDYCIELAEKRKERKKKKAQEKN